MSDLKVYLDKLVEKYETPSFIEDDPISIPHAFDDPRDQEVIGLYAATLAWGRRSVILSKLAELCERMDYRPYRFVRDFDERRDGGKLEGFVHRTFQPVDALWFTKSLSEALERFGSVEELFTRRLSPDDPHTSPAIQGFSETMLSMLPGCPQRLRKHLSRPQAGSACKRLNMYLRWMVRPGPVDLNLWSTIRTDQLVLPLDVHAATQVRKLGLITRKSTDWKAALQVTRICRRMCESDPARYDFAFFGVGVSGASLDEEFVTAGSGD